jgi:hypothetical protein
LQLLLEKLAIEHLGMPHEPDEKAKKQPKATKAQKQNGAAEDDGEDDGPGAAANAVVLADNKIVCIKCSGDHHIKALKPNGEPYHTPGEINEFYAERKAAKLKARTVPEPAPAQHGGKGKQFGGQNGKGAKGKGKGQGKGKGKDQGTGHGKGKGKGYSDTWQDSDSYRDNSGKGKGRGGGGWHDHTEQWSDYGKGKGKGYPIAAAARQAESTRHIAHLEALLHEARASKQAEREQAESERAASSGGASPDDTWHEGYWGDDGYWYSYYSASHGGKSPRA